MSYLLELLGRGLDVPMMSMVLPWSRPLATDDVKMLETAIESNPGHIGNLLRIAIHYAQNGDMQKAEKIFARLLELNPANLDVMLAWSAMYAAQGALDKALDRLEKAGQIETDARVLYAMGYCHERKGKLDHAQKHYQKGTELRPYLRQNRERLAAIDLFRMNYPKVIEYLRVLQREHPEEVWYCLALGQIYMQIKQYDQAIAAFEKALTIEPDNFDTHNDEIDAMVKAGQVEEAIERMKTVMEDENGAFADSFIRLGDLYSQLGNDKLAVSSYQRALEVHPGYLEAAVKLGTQHMRMQRFYDAAIMFNNAVEINDRIIAAYTGLGVAQHQCGRTAEADDTLELAAALEPNTNLLYAEMNRLQMKMVLKQKQNDPFSSGNILPNLPIMQCEDLLDAQLDRHRQALARTPDQASLHYNYAVLMRGRGDIKEAEYHLRRALTINPAYQKATIKLGLLLRETGHQAESMKVLMDSMTLDEESAELHYRLGVMYCDRIQFAVMMEQIGLKTDKDSKSAYIRSNVMLALQNMGLVDRAMYAWRAVCELEPDSPLAFKAQRLMQMSNHQAHPF